MEFKHDWVGKVIHKGIVQEIIIWYIKMVYAQTRICSKEEIHKIL